MPHTPTPSGLSQVEVANRLAQYGPNALQKDKSRAALWQFLSQFKNPLVIILLVASAITALTGDATGALIIGTIVVLSVTLDFVQAYRAGQAADRLAQQVAVRARTLRDGLWADVPVADLVPGDWVQLSAGISSPPMRSCARPTTFL